jgi:hypothetical protein
MTEGRREDDKRKEGKMKERSAHAAKKKAYKNDRIHKHTYIYKMIYIYIYIYIYTHTHNNKMIGARKVQQRKKENCVLNKAGHEG